MILADKIVRLRKQLSWSQEELAEKMDVSRQSVSKWESTNSIPDLNKIIRLAEIFDVSTDFLLRDDIETADFLGEGKRSDAPQISLEQAVKYVDIKLDLAHLIAKGVVLCVCSAIPLFMLMLVADKALLSLAGDKAVILGIIGLLAMISMGISFFVKTQRSDSDLASIDGEQFELSFGVHSAISDKLQKFTALYHKRLSLSIALFVFSGMPLLIALLYGRPDMTLIMLIVMLLMIAAGIYALLPVATQFNAYHFILKEGDLDAGKSSGTKQAERLAAFYWPLLLATYLGWSFWTMSWGVTWIIWPVGAVTFVALVGLMNLLKAKPE